MFDMKARFVHDHEKSNANAKIAFSLELFSRVAQKLPRRSDGMVGSAPIRIIHIALDGEPTLPLMKQPFVLVSNDSRSFLRSF